MNPASLPKAPGPHFCRLRSGTEAVADVKFTPHAGLYYDLPGVARHFRLEWDDESPVAEWLGPAVRGGWPAGGADAAPPEPATA